MRAMLVCALGDLTLDVIVRLAGPIAAEGIRTPRSASDRAARPRTSLRGRPSSARRLASSERQARTKQAASCDRSSRRTVSTSAGRSRAQRVDLLARLSGWQPLDGRRPRLGPRASRRRDRSGVVRRLRRPARLRLRAHARAGSEAAAIRGRAGARCGCGYHHRSRVLERDSRQRGRRLRRGAGRTRAGVVFATAEEERVVGRSLVDAYWIVKHGAQGARSARTSARPFPSSRFSTRPERATPLRRAGSSAGRPRARRRCPLRPAGRRDAASVTGVTEVIHVSDEVRTALDESRPVVALETTIVAHGFPAPHGLEVGIEMEAAVRAAGATPATIGVLGGGIRIGLDESELAQFDSSARKLGPRDLAACAESGETGAATVGAFSLPHERSASGSWGQVGSAACTVDTRHRPTSQPTSSPSSRLRCSWPAPARSRSSTFPRRRNIWRRSGPGARLPNRHDAALLRGGGRPR